MGGQAITAGGPDRRQRRPDQWRQAPGRRPGSAACAGPRRRGRRGRWPKPSSTPTRRHEPGLRGVGPRGHGEATRIPSLPLVGLRRALQAHRRRSRSGPVRSRGEGDGRRSSGRSADPAPTPRRPPLVGGGGPTFDTMAGEMTAVAAGRDDPRGPPRAEAVVDLDAISANVAALAQHVGGRDADGGRQG